MKDAQTQTTPRAPRERKSTHTDAQVQLQRQ